METCLLGGGGLVSHKRIHLCTGCKDRTDGGRQRQDWHLVITSGNEQCDGHFLSIPVVSSLQALLWAYTPIISALQVGKLRPRDVMEAVWSHTAETGAGIPGCVAGNWCAHRLRPSCPRWLTGRGAQRWAADSKDTVQAGSTFLAGSVSPPQLCCLAWTSGQRHTPIKANLQNQAGAMVSQPEQWIWLLVKRILGEHERGHDTEPLMKIFDFQGQRVAQE